MKSSNLAINSWNVLHNVSLTYLIFTFKIFEEILSMDSFHMYPLPLMNLTFRNTKIVLKSKASIKIWLT